MPFKVKCFWQIFQMINDILYSLFWKAKVPISLLNCVNEFSFFTTFIFDLFDELFNLTNIMKLEIVKIFNIFQVNIMFVSSIQF